MEKVKTWQEMREWMAGLLVKGTGEGVEVWNQRIAEQDFQNEKSLRDWLAKQGVTGYAQMLLVMERFGYPEFFLASADKLIDDQYTDRPNLRPILDAVLAAVQSFGLVTIQARKTYISLVTPKRTFAIVKATTRQRVDVGIRLDGMVPGGRLQKAMGLGNDTINLKISFETPEDIDEEAISFLEQAYKANS